MIGLVNIVRVGGLEKIIHRAGAALGLKAADDHAVLELDAAAFLHARDVAGDVEDAGRHEVVHHVARDHRDRARGVDQRGADAHGGDGVLRAIAVGELAETVKGERTTVSSVVAGAGPGPRFGQTARPTRRSTGKTARWRTAGNGEAGLAQVAVVS
jgi:hypothetical protein